MEHKIKIPVTPFLFSTLALVGCNTTGNKLGMKQNNNNQHIVTNQNQNLNMQDPSGQNNEATTSSGQRSVLASCENLPRERALFPIRNRQINNDNIETLNEPDSRGNKRDSRGKNTCTSFFPRQEINNHSWHNDNIMSNAEPEMEKRLPLPYWKRQGFDSLKAYNEAPQWKQRKFHSEKAYNEEVQRRQKEYNETPRWKRQGFNSEEAYNEAPFWKQEGFDSQEEYDEEALLLVDFHSF